MVEQARQHITTKQPRVQIRRPRSNMRLLLSIVPNFAKGTSKATVPRTPAGEKGTYRVTFILGIPGKQGFFEDVDFAQFMESGESLLAPPPGQAVRAQIFNETEQQEVQFIPNSRGVLAKAVLGFQAKSFQHARAIAYDLVTSILSRWSFRYDVAIEIVGHEIIEEATEVMNYSTGVVGQIMPMTPGDQGQSKPEHREVLSAYREGVNATNVFYKLLCFWRVIEGARWLRGLRRARLRANGRTFQNPPNERIPLALNVISVLDEDEREAFRPYLGDKFTKVLDDLRPVLRNAAAHLEPEQVHLVADKAEDITKCEQAIPVVRYIARVMLDHEFQADEQDDEVAAAAR